MDTWFELLPSNRAAGNKVPAPFREGKGTEVPV